MSTSKKFTARLACVNWDSEVPMRVEKHRVHQLERKVITQGIKKVYLYPEIMIDVIESLRKGFEVRFYTGSKNEQLRLYPVVLKDMKTVVVAAQVMKDSTLRNCLNDKKVKLVRQKDDIKTLADAKKVDNETKKERRRMVCVTPDTMVLCPTCGTNFRVGKCLCDKK